MEALKKNNFLFSFAIVSDSHIKPESGDESSPYETNLLANARNRYVIQEINRRAPAFVIHLGDLVHPIPDLPTYDSAAETFKTIYGRLNQTLYVVPGNHDVGDKPLDFMPAAKVSEDRIGRYNQHFGNGHQRFSYKDCDFILINASLLNSNLESEKKQQKWMLKELQSNLQKRRFLFLHYPPYIMNAHEPSHYDNIDEPARSWLLSVIEKFGFEAVFSGHVHHFFYNRYAQTELYIVPSLTFIRHDYSEFFRVKPEDGTENGRNDLGKFGFLMVRVYKNGHAIECIRTYGKTMEMDQRTESPSPKLVMYHPKESLHAPVGLYLRHPWVETTKLPFNGPLDEFIRKEARNDYPLMAIWELGVKKLRVPVADLIDPDTRKRIMDLTASGHEFTLFTFGLPNSDLLAIIKQHHNLINAIEIILPWQDAAACIIHLVQMRKSIPVPLYLSKLMSSADEKHQGSKFSHNIGHGFRIDHHQELAAYMRNDHASEAVDGFVFRLDMDNSPWLDFRTINDLSSALNIKASVYIRLAAENMAQENCDDRRIANMVAETVAAAFAYTDIDVFIDTFVDIDRGYFVRHGLVDRRYNPRLAGNVFRYLTRALEVVYNAATVESVYSKNGGQLYMYKDDKAFYGLITSISGATIHMSALMPEEEITGLSGTGQCIDLNTGEIAAFIWKKIQTNGTRQIAFEPDLTFSTPSFVSLFSQPPAGALHNPKN